MAQTILIKMVYCANLLFEEKIIDRENFIDLIKQGKSLSMTIDSENYYYRNFNSSLFYFFFRYCIRISKF